MERLQRKEQRLRRHRSFRKNAEVILPVSLRRSLAVDWEYFRRSEPKAIGKAQFIVPAETARHSGCTAFASRRGEHPAATSAEQRGARDRHEFQVANSYAVRAYMFIL